MCSIKLWDEVQFLVKLEDMLLDEMRFILNCSDYHHVGSMIEFQALVSCMLMGSTNIVKGVRETIFILYTGWAGLGLTSVFGSA